MKRVLIPTGDALEILEVFYPLYKLREEGYEVKVAILGRGPQLPVASGFLRDRKVSAFFVIESDVNMADGGHLDGNFVSGRAWTDLPEIMREFLRLLRG